MSVEERASAAERVLAARERYVARGVSTPALVVARAEGARVWDVDGREFLDFAGGIACQNLGHGPSAVVAAIHEQVDRYLHQCFMVGTYEPYIEVCRRLDELWPTAAEGGRNSRPGGGGVAADASSHPEAEGTSTRRTWRASCSSRCRARAASSRCRRSSCRRCAASATSTGFSTSTTRCSRAAAAPGRCGRSSSSASSPTCSSAGRRSEAGCHS